MTAVDCVMWTWMLVGFALSAACIIGGLWSAGTGKTEGDVNHDD